MSFGQSEALLRVISQCFRRQPAFPKIPPLNRLAAGKRFRPVAGFVAEVQFTQAWIYEDEGIPALARACFTELQLVCAFDESVVKCSIGISRFATTRTAENLCQLVSNDVGMRKKLAMYCLGTGNIKLEAFCINAPSGQFGFTQGLQGDHHRAVVVLDFLDADAAFTFRQQTAFGKNIAGDFFGRVMQQFQILMHLSSYR